MAAGTWQWGAPLDWRVENSHLGGKTEAEHAVKRQAWWILQLQRLWDTRYSDDGMNIVATRQLRHPHAQQPVCHT